MAGRPLALQVYSLVNLSTPHKNFPCEKKEEEGEGRELEKALCLSEKKAHSLLVFIPCLGGFPLYPAHTWQLWQHMQTPRWRLEEQTPPATAFLSGRKACLLQLCLWKNNQETEEAFETSL